MDRWARLVLGRVGAGAPRERDGRVVASVRTGGRFAPGPWVEAIAEVVGNPPDAVGRTDLALLVVDAARGAELSTLRPGGVGVVVGASLDAVLGLGRRSPAPWRGLFAPHAVLIGRGGRAALWFVRGVRPAGRDPRLVVLRDRARDTRKVAGVDRSAPDGASQDQG